MAEAPQLLVATQPHFFSLMISVIGYVSLPRDSSFNKRQISRNIRNCELEFFTKKISIANRKTKLEELKHSKNNFRPGSLIHNFRPHRFNLKLVL